MLKIRFFDPADEPKPKKTTYRLTNWSAYNQALWLDEDTIANWYYKGPNKPGGRYRYSDACIQCALSLKSVLKLAFSQTQGLMQSLIESIKLPLTVPSYSQLWRRQTQLIQESMGLTRGKTDQVDARRIALFAYKNPDEARLWKPKRPVMAQLDRLTAQRARLVKVIKMLQTPLTDSAGFVDKADRKAAQQACKASLQALKADLKLADKAIAELAEQDPELKRLFERVTSVVGISQITAAQIILTTNEFQDITDPGKFACYAGVVPFERSSGQRKGRPQVSQIANKKVKSLLHLGAMSAIQHCTQLKAYYQRKVSEGKNKMLVLNNVRNKLVLRVFACVREDRNYDKNYTPALV